MSEKTRSSGWLSQAIVLVLLAMPHFISARIDNVVVVMPKGPRTLQMLGSISPQLLHTISDVLKPVPPNVVQVPVPYYPDQGNTPSIQHQKQYTNALNSAYFTSPFAHHVTPSTISTATSYTPFAHSTSPNSVPYPFSFDPHSIQPGPYDTPFMPKLKPSPVNPLHIENPPEIRFTPINLLPPAPPSFDTIRNYVQKLKAKQKEFFDTQGYEYGLFTQPNTKPTSYHRPVEQKKKYKHKYKHHYEALFSQHPNELSYIGDANLEPQEEDNVYYTEPDAGNSNKYYYTNTEGHEFVLPPENEFRPVPLGGILDPDDAHFIEHGDELLLKTKHPDAAIVTPNQLDAFIEFENQLGLHPKYTEKRLSGIRRPLKIYHRNKRFKKNDRVGRASGDEDDDADFYDSDEKKKIGELDFEDVEDEIRTHENFEPKKTYTQVRHLETTVKKSKPENEPKIKEKVTISKTNIVYSEKGEQETHFDHGAEESFGEFQSKSKVPKKHRGKRDVSSASFEEQDEGDEDDGTADSDDDNSSRENDIEFEFYPEHEYHEDINDTDKIYMPYAQALVFQNDTDMFVLPIPEALVDPRKLMGEDLLNFLDEAIKNSTEFLPPEKEKTVKISPEIQSLQGQELIQFLDEAIKTSNQYLLNGPGDAIELVNPPRLGGVDDVKEQAAPLRADHVIEFEMEPPRPEDVHSEVLKFTQQHVLPDAPEYEVVNFVQPFKTLLRLQKGAADDYEIEFDAQDPRQLHGEDLIRFLDEAIGNTSLYIPEEYNDPHKPTPYLRRAFHYVDVDTALGLADNISTEVTDYLKDRIIPQPVELESDDGSEFAPVRRTSDGNGDPGNYNDVSGRGKDKQSNPEVAVYNDVIRHIKNHMSASKSSKSKNGNVFMIAVPRSMRANKTRNVERRQDGAFDSLRLATVYPLPIFDINQFYPTVFSGNSGGGSFEIEDNKKDEFQQALEHEAERLVEKQSSKPPSKDQAPHEQRLSTKSHFRNGIPEAFHRDRSRYRGPRPGPQQFPHNSYAVKEKIRDYPQPTFKKPGPPYEAIPLPPSNPKTKLSSLNAASNQRAVRKPPPPQFSSVKKRKRTHHRPYKKLKRVPSGVRTKIRIIKR